MLGKNSTIGLLALMSSVKVIVESKCVSVNFIASMCVQRFALDHAFKSCEDLLIVK